MDLVPLACEDVPKETPHKIWLLLEKLFQKRCLKLMVINMYIASRQGKTSACLIMLSTKQGSQRYHFNAFGMARPGFEPTTSDI